MMWSSKAASVSPCNYGCWINTQKRRGESFPATWNWGQTRRKERSRCTHFPSVLCSHPLPSEYQAVFSRAYYQSTFKTSQTIDKGPFEAANAANVVKASAEILKRVWVSWLPCRSQETQHLIIIWFCIIWCLFDSAFRSSWLILCSEKCYK